MRKLIFAGGGALLLALSGSAFADGWGLGAKAGTLGAGVEITKSFSPKFNARLGLNGYKYSDDRTESGIKYDGELDLKSTSLFLDYHPFEGTFRISVGYLFSNNELDLDAKGTGQSVTVGSTPVTIDPGDQLKGTVDLQSGGYVGIGWGNAGQKGWGFSGDIGVVFQGSPDVSLTASQSLKNKGVTDADLRQEEKSLEDDLDSFKQYPVIAVGVSYGF
jgi:hypothetical protein